METVVSQFCLNAVKNPDNNALWIKGHYYTYRCLQNKAISLSKLFLSISQLNSRCAILSGRNIHFYQSLLGALFSGKAYLPINPKFLLEKNLQMIKAGKPEILCIDSGIDEIAIKILEEIEPVHVCVFDKNLLQLLKNSITKHKYYYWNEDNSDSNLQHDYSSKNYFSVSSDDYAYLMFTSGSTGHPKGILVSHANLVSYVNSICEIFKPDMEDRFSQFSEVTFDLSVHDIFVCWAAGATLYVIPENYIFGIKKFIQKYSLTYWLGVPSTVALLDQLGQLQLDLFPSLKHTFFCGEPLLHSQACKWKKAAPNSSIINIYGPTEATIAFTYFNWNLNSTREYSETVPIGVPLPNQFCCLIDSNGSLCKEGEVGELCLAGTQVINSYWDNSEQTKKVFKKFSWDADQKLWYKTGDFARWDDRCGYIYLGRLDDQWKIRGYLVEKLEIENELRKIADNDSIAVVPLILSEGQVDGIVAFVTEAIEPDFLLKNSRRRLPDMMVPKKIITLTEFPKNSNGKIDYSHLKSLIRTGVPEK